MLLAETVESCLRVILSNSAWTSVKPGFCPWKNGRQSPKVISCSFCVFINNSFLQPASGWMGDGGVWMVMRSHAGGWRLFATVNTHAKLIRHVQHELMHVLSVLDQKVHVSGLRQRDELCNVSPQCSHSASLQSMFDFIILNKTQLKISTADMQNSGGYSINRTISWAKIAVVYDVRRVILV